MLVHAGRRPVQIGIAGIALVVVAAFVWGFIAFAQGKQAEIAHHEIAANDARKEITRLTKESDDNEKKNQKLACG